MTAPHQNDAADGLAALSHFLRGVERRAVVLAELQAGDPIRAEQAYAVALRQFRAQALAQPYLQWPRLFWRTLLASPQLGQGGRPGRWPEALSPLGQAAPGARAALLLRLAAGLTEADAAAALGVAPPPYRRALREALPRGAGDRPDPEAWRRLDEAIRHAVAALPAERLAHLARLREAAVQGRRPELIGPMPVPAAAADPPPGTRLRRVLWAGVGTCVLALAATFVLPHWWPAGEGDARIAVSALPSAARPAGRYDPAFALLTERDFDLLLAGPQAAPADDPGFYAWLAAGAVAPEPEEPGATAGDAVAAPAATVPETMAQTESDDASPQTETADAPR